MLVDVLVQAGAGQAAERIVVAITEEAGPSRQRKELFHRVRELSVDDSRPYPGAMFAPVTKGDPAPANRDMALTQRRDAESPRRPRIAIGPDPEPAEVDQPHRERAGPFRLEGLAFQMLAHRLPELRKALGKPHQAVEFLLLLACSEFGVVEV